MNSAAALEVLDLCLSFGALAAVNGFSFAAHRGRITSVIGPNGAGKSTLLNLVSGALRPQRGRVLFEGRDVTGWSTHRLLRAGLARSFQVTNLFFDLTVFENLRLAAQVLEPLRRALLPAARSRRAQERAEEMLERFALRTRAGALAGELSHGEQRRLEVAMALVSRPRLLLLDEPTQGMSHADTQATVELIEGLGRDLAIVLVEHDIDVVMRLSDHVVVMHQGAKLADGTPQEVRGNALVQQVYLGGAH